MYDRFTLVKFFIRANGGIVLVPNLDYLKKFERSVLQAVLRSQAISYGKEYQNLKIKCSLWILRSQISSAWEKKPQPGCSRFLHEFKNVEFFDLIVDVGGLGKKREVFFEKQYIAEILEGLLVDAEDPEAKGPGEDAAARKVD